MAVGEAIDDVGAVNGNVFWAVENPAELLLMVLPEGIAVSEDIDDEAVKGNAAQLLLAASEDIDDTEAVKKDTVCGEENAAQLLLI